MRMLRVFIDDFDFLKLGFSSDEISFSELKRKLSIGYAKESLLKCHQFAEESGLSDMTLEEINAEIQAVRNHAKTCH
jgi:hypothetical protein